VKGGAGGEGVSFPPTFWWHAYISRVYVPRAASRLFLTEVAQWLPTGLTH